MNDECTTKPYLLYYYYIFTSIYIPNKWWTEFKKNINIF